MNQSFEAWCNELLADNADSYNYAELVMIEDLMRIHFIVPPVTVLIKPQRKRRNYVYILPDIKQSIAL